MKYNLIWLENEMHLGHYLDYFGFWGNKNDTQMERSFSNFYKSPMTIKIFDGREVTFECNEQYFMYRKALQFGDFVTLEKIIQRGLSPQKYKELGREVENFDNDVWDSVRYNAMLDGLREKFSQNALLKQYLMATQNKVIVECSGFDKIWGCGHFKKDKQGKIINDWKNPKKWTGKNLLGFALMELRDELKK